MTRKTVAETSSTKIAGKAYRSGAGVRQNKAGDRSWVRSGHSESELSVGGAVALFSRWTSNCTQGPWRG